MRSAFCCAVVILLACSAVPGRADIVTNGSFEDVTPFYGWLPSYATIGSSSLTVNDFYNHTPGGTFSAAFGASGPGYDQLAQPLATISGDTYLVSFWLFPGSATDPGTSSFQEYVDGILGVDPTSTAVAGGWSLFTSRFTGTGDNMLMFQGYNFNDYYYLDDVSVTDTTVPEPATFGLLGCALVVAAASRRLRRRT
jgi:PEP-CTERM motif